jgi:hypothetical protein
MFQIEVMHQVSLLSHELLIIELWIRFFEVELWFHSSHVLPSVLVFELCEVFALASFSWPWLIAVNLSVFEQLIVVVAMLLAFLHLFPNFVLWHWIILNEYYSFIICRQKLCCHVNLFTSVSVLIINVSCILLLDTFHICHG